MMGLPRQGAYSSVPVTSTQDASSTEFVSLELEDDSMLAKTSHKKKGHGRPEEDERCSNPAHGCADAKQLMQYDRMLNWMIISYMGCLALGWGLLLGDYIFNELEKHPKAEPWINDAVIIGGASAVLSPIIQWGHTILHSKPEASAVAARRYHFFCCMWLIYVTIVGTSTLVAVVRFAMGEDGTLHHFIATTSNHLVLARISASLISWTSGKLFIKWYRDRLSAGPLF
ncbi:hypothetical protein WJX72_006410 [[Myrmecia] bisecta]|uniref:Uncharacterized protein n=1 Tax=[Myrmecia] bisecta TaxID=41462 RepID=A0AAW1Q7K0_9CHLO